MRRVVVPVVGLITLSAAGAALAADLPELGPPPAPPIVEFASNWYVRLDAGGGFPDVYGDSLFGKGFTSTQLGEMFTGGGGFGFKTGWFRSDLTVDYGLGPQFTGSVGSTTVTADLSSITALINGYFDLGTWAGFTPYIGGGVGMSSLKAGSVGDSAPGFGTLTSSQNLAFAWAANAGVSYSISHNWLVDLSYRYLDLGTAHTNILGLGNINYGNVTANQVRIGLRYQID